MEYLPSVFSDAPKSYSFIYLGNVDDTGHFSLGGWCGSQYSDAVAAADLQVRNICIGLPRILSEVHNILTAIIFGFHFIKVLNQDRKKNFPQFMLRSKVAKSFTSPCPVIVVPRERNALNHTKTPESRTHN